MRDLDERFAAATARCTTRSTSTPSWCRLGIDSDVDMLEGAAAAARRVVHPRVLDRGRRAVQPVGRPPPRAGRANGDAAFVLSVRGIGEGHRSSIGFRTGTRHRGRDRHHRPPGPVPRDGNADARPANHRSRAPRQARRRRRRPRERGVRARRPAGRRSTTPSSTLASTNCAADVATRRHTATTINHLRSVARSSYRRRVPRRQRALRARAVAAGSRREPRHGGRPIRSIHRRRRRRSRTTRRTPRSTAAHVAQHLLETTDFATFTASPMAGDAAVGKGLALFPRKVGGRYVALSRSDRETNSIAFSDDLRCWDTAETIQVPDRPWEILQLGNCGSPIETDAGWLVLTHGVGADAHLLARRDPARPRRASPRAGPIGTTPIISPDEQPTRRLRAQRRLLVRRLRAQRHARAAVRHRRPEHLDRHDVDQRVARVDDPGELIARRR